MKKYNIIFTLLLSLMFYSCESWLDIKPYDNIEVDKVYDNERTTNSALNSLYVSLSNDNLYGKELSCGLIEVIAQHFTIPSNKNHTYYHVNLYDYSEGKSLFANVFKDAYKAIADCNTFLEKINLGKEMYKEENFKIYNGEAIAIRTLLHFDMLRLFGPIYADEKNVEAIPYYSVSTAVPKPILTAEATVDSLLRDIDIAINYLKNDPILTTGPNMVTSDVDFFKDYRNCRMNYYAAAALKARICLYKGDENSLNKAYEIASNLISGKDPLNSSVDTNFNSSFKFIKSGEQEYVFYTEPIFCIHNTNRKDVQRKLFNSDLDNTQIMGGSSAFYKELYEGGSTGTAIGGIDPGPRARMWQWDGIKSINLFQRIAAVSPIPAAPYRHEFQSVIRLGELYLIAAETAPDTDKKRTWLEELRTAKGYDAGNADGLNESQLDELIAREFEKETYGEGQYFFFAKRNKLALRNQNGATVALDKAKFTPNLPEIETDFRNNNK